MSAWQKIIVGIFAVAAWGVALWVGFAWPALAVPMAEVKMLAQGVLSGLGMYHLLITPPPASAAVQTPQAASDTSTPPNP